MQTNECCHKALYFNNTFCIIAAACQDQFLFYALIFSRQTQYVYYESLGGFDICCIWVDGGFFCYEKTKRLSAYQNGLRKECRTCIFPSLCQIIFYWGEYIEVLIHESIRLDNSDQLLKAEFLWETNFFWSFHTTLGANKMRKTNENDYPTINN